MPRLAWNASKRRVPRNASRRTRSVQRSPITESVRAIVQSSLPTSLQRTRPYSSKMELDASGGDRASPGVRFGRLAARAREDAVELRERVLGEPELERAEARVELLQGARPDDGRRDGRGVQHPCQRHLGGRVSQLATECLVGRHPVTVALEQALLPLARAPALGRLLQGAAQEPSRERAVRNEPEAVREQAADDLLGDALARAPAVHVGRVEEDDPELERAVHDGEAVALAGEWAEVHGAEAEPADPEPALAETDVVHAGVSTTPRGVSGHGPPHGPRARAP